MVGCGAARSRFVGKLVKFLPVLDMDDTALLDTWNVVAAKDAYDPGTFLSIWSLNRYGDSHESATTVDFFFFSNCSPVFANLGSDGYHGGRRLPLCVEIRPSFPGPVRRGRPVAEVEEPHVRRIVDGPNRL